MAVYSPRSPAERSQRPRFSASETYAAPGLLGVMPCVAVVRQVVPGVVLPGLVTAAVVHPVAGAAASCAQGQAVGQAVRQREFGGQDVVARPVVGTVERIAGIRSRGVTGSVIVVSVGGVAGVVGDQFQFGAERVDAPDVVGREGQRPAVRALAVAAVGRRAA